MKHPMLKATAFAALATVLVFAQSAAQDPVTPPIAGTYTLHKVDKNDLPIGSIRIVHQERLRVTFVSHAVRPARRVRRDRYLRRTIKSGISLEGRAKIRRNCVIQSRTSRPGKEDVCWNVAVFDIVERIIVN